ncbi:hypothetical protein K040078D81_47400 [Blautia hominis]|uniref:RNase H type-1 domain-containing protein n=1 Tax=Blautia hominis TaxID=2025493 RepID=A0ABQ0BGN4_9FIRM|nr:RNase H family protein [Blautia sp. NSJ-175]MCJ7849226.1 hypothetical protein [Blautia sp. NSJ-175]
MQRVDIYIETDSTSPRTQARKYGYVLECELRGRPVTREGFGQTEGTYNQSVLTALTEALARIKQPCEIHIHSGNEFVLNMVDNNLSKWAAGGFLSGKGKPVANREEWETIWNLLKGQMTVTEHGGHAYSGWLKNEMERRELDV